VVVNEIEIRNITADELPTMGLVLTSAFGNPIPPSDLHRFGKNLELERTFCCFDGDVMVGTSGNFSLTMTVPGGQVACAGVTMVSVRASHTRRGLMRRMMRSLIDDARARNEPLAALWASEENIYQRFGFGLGANEGHMNVERNRFAFVDDPGPVGRVRLIDLEDAEKVLPSIYDRLLPEVPGMLARNENWWKWHRLLDTERHRGGGSPLSCAVLDIDGDDRGYVLYRVHPEWTSGGTSNMWLKVEELVGIDPVATREMWRFVFGIDLVERVRAWWLPTDLPLTLMTSEPRRLQFSASESLWLRLVDVAAALNARTLRGETEVVIGVADDFCDWNNGRYRVSGAGAEPTDAPADIRLGVGALAAVYLGEFTFNGLARALRAEELTQGALDRADSLFWTPRAPWCPENF
jgi:predicted acetyltransferase